MKEAVFELSDEFISKFKGKQPKWGALGYITYKRTYSRPINGKAEDYWQTVQRVVEGVFTIQKRHCATHSLPFNQWKAQSSAQKMFELMWEFKFTPPGRGLWMMGTEYMYTRGGAALNNCAFTSTENLAVDFAEPFCFLMDMSMLGVGVGGDCKGAGKVTIKEPRMDGTHVVEDTREGWVNILKRVLNAFVHKDTMPDNIDYSQVRPYGAKIAGFGGTASGPQPLIDLIDDVKKILNSRVSQDVTSTDIVDIFNLVGKCVVSGNVRRSAEIMFGHPEDEEFMQLKDPEKNKGALMNHRWASNNSIFAEVGMDYTKVAELTAKNGEPGYMWLENAQRFSRMDGVIDNKDYRAKGGNPCLAKGTMVQVVGEGPIKIEELSNRTEPFFVYSMNKKGALTINKAHAFLSKKHAETLKLKFATGKELICTPDHKIAIDKSKDGGVPEWWEAQDLQIGYSGVAFQRIKKGYGYLRVKLSTENTYTPEHRKVFKAFNTRNILGEHIHHIDDNPFNNHPNNLEALSSSEHGKITNLGHKNYATQDELGRFNGSAKDPEWNISKDAPEHLLTKNIAGGSTRLKSIEEGPIVDVYDLSVENDHCFIANDIVVHNCLEQTLEPYELCCLVETYPSNHDTLEEWHETLKYAYLYAKTVTLMPTHNELTNAVMLRNRRIGCSMSGIVQAFTKFGRRNFLEESSVGYDKLQRWDKVYSDWLCIPRSIKTTSIKPSGTVSLLSGVTPGIHYPISEHYIRNIRFQEGSPLLKFLDDAGYTIEKDKYSNNTLVVSFPVKEKYFNRSIEDVTMWEQLENACQIQEYWADNQVSVTISFAPEEAKDIKNALELYETRLKGVSFLPKRDHGYEQAPYIPISKKDYELMVENLDKIKKIKKNTHEITEKFCDTDSCQI